MSNNVAWLLLSFAIMVVAVLATLYEKVEQLEKRLKRLEAGGEPDDDGLSAHLDGLHRTEGVPAPRHGVR